MGCFQEQEMLPRARCFQERDASKSKGRFQEREDFATHGNTETQSFIRQSQRTQMLDRKRKRRDHQQRSHSSYTQKMRVEASALPMQAVVQTEPDSSGFSIW
ncbi:hypothetical protein K456DRAFT_59001 [Colletotrichum gloeosporioides 23]|nr:hypothetical protein K456DRAFT_59001 [Colletotrichum gloeosporioides 23]